MTKQDNKSELIRAAIAQNPTAKVGEIAALLLDDGVEVSRPLIYQVRKNDGSPKTTTADKTSRKAAAANPSSTKDLIAAMKSFVDAAGGLDEAIALLSVFKK